MPDKLLIKFCCLNEYKEIVNKMFYGTFCVSRTIICTQRQLHYDITLFSIDNVSTQILNSRNIRWKYNSTGGRGKGDTNEVATDQAKNGMDTIKNSSRLVDNIHDTCIVSVPVPVWIGLCKQIVTIDYLSPVHLTSFLISVYSK